MNRIDRLMGIINLLQSKKHRTIDQIAAHFGISERTAFRDLRAIGEIGIPIRHEPEKGYAVGSDFFLPPVSLTVEEAHALTLAEPLIIRFAEKGVHRQYVNAMAKIKMVLGRTQQDSMAVAQQQTQHYIPDQYAHMLRDTDHLMPLQQAIVEKRIVRLHYLNAAGETTLREVEPIGLTFYSLNWHLIGWCNLRQDYRDFRTSRIQHLRVTMQPFQKQDHISLQQYLQDIGE